MPETWVWLVVGLAAVAAALLVRALVVRRRRRLQEPQREDIYPMF